MTKDKINEDKRYAAGIAWGSDTIPYSLSGYS